MTNTPRLARIPNAQLSGSDLFKLWSSRYGGDVSLSASQLTEFIVNSDTGYAEALNVANGAKNTANAADLNADLAKRNAGVTPFDFGATGVGDDGPAIQAAMDYVASIGGGCVWFPSLGWSWNTGQTLLHDAKVTLKGHAGRAEILALPSMTGRLLETRDFDAIVAVGTSAGAGSQTFVFEDLIFNANAPNRGGYVNSGADAVCLYGRDFLLKNIYIKAAPRAGLRAYYLNGGGSGISPYNANLQSVYIDVSGAEGIDWRISDSNWQDINIASPSQIADNTYDAVFCNRLVRWTNGAIWRKGFHTNKHRYGINNSSGGCSFVGVNIETAATAAIRNTGSHCRFDVYTYNIIAAAHIDNSGNYSVFDVTAQRSTLGTEGAYVVQNTGGKNAFRILCTGNLIPINAAGNYNHYNVSTFIDNGAAAYAGTFGSSDRVSMSVDRNGTVENITIIPGEVTGTAVASTMDDSSATKLAKVGHGSMTGTRLPVLIADANSYTLQNRRTRLTTTGANTPISGQGWVMETTMIQSTDTAIEVAWCVTADGRNRMAWRHSNNAGNARNNWTFVLTNQSGATIGRPSNAQVGEQFFDTTLTKPIWWSGSVWVDATGATV